MTTHYEKDADRIRTEPCESTAEAVAYALVSIGALALVGTLILAVLQGFG